VLVLKEGVEFDFVVVRGVGRPDRGLGRGRRKPDINVAHENKVFGMGIELANSGSDTICNRILLGPCGLELVLVSIFGSWVAFVRWLETQREAAR
tara:strand:+ start:19665 stop:19949 length:285 start_codon:yes stop_codon:yes gene_type:complete